METKICSKCKKEKIVIEFNKNKGQKDGYHNYCRKCDNENNRINREKLRKQNLTGINNKEIKRICSLCREEKSINLFSKDIGKPLGRRYECRECRKKQDKQYRLENPDKVKKWAKKFRDNPINKEKRKIWDREHYQKQIREKYSNDECFRFKKNITNLIRNSLGNKGYKKGTKTEKILNTSLEQFKKYIETLFLENMNWENRSDWHLDHVIPISYASNIEEAIRLNDYRNFSPKWKFDNLSKHNKILINELKPIHHQLYSDILERNGITYDRTKTVGIL